MINTPNDYIELYRKMGCTPYIYKFFHQFDNLDLGVICRAYHLSKAYAISIRKGIKKDLLWCKEHKKAHSTLITDENVHEMISKCPISGITHEHPRYYDEVFGGALVTYDNDINKMRTEFSQARTVYFLQFLWDNKVLNRQNFRRGFSALPQQEKINQIRAFIPLLEIDAADIDKDDAKKGRYDIFQEKVFNDFKTSDEYITQKFDDLFGTGYFKKSFSGNGIYYIGYPIPVNNTDELNKVYRAFIYTFCRKIINHLKETDLKYITVDAPFPQWNSYYKIPFTLHKKYNRICIPVPPNKTIDYNYITTYSNPDNINPEISEMIWKNAGYK